jgi:hypothetical protein
VSDAMYAAIAAQVNAVAAVRYHAEVTLLQYPAQGDFAWCYQNPDQVFNQRTLDYLSARVSPGEAPGLARLSPPGGLTQAYARLLEQVDYVLDPADQERQDPVVLGAQRAARARLAQLRAATAHPDLAHGGILTVDPVTGALSSRPQPAYVVPTPLATIRSGLDDLSLSLTVSAPWPQGGTVSLTYAGCVLVAAGPLAWQDATAQGWFDPEPLSQAFRAGGSTGYAFTTPPPYAPGTVADGGTVARLTGLLLSRPPTVTVTAAAGPALVGDAVGLPGDTSVLAPLSLLGLGTATGVPYRVEDATRTIAREGAGQVTLTPQPGPTVPQLQQTAYVIGAVLAGL